MSENAQLTPAQLRSIAWTVMMEHNRIGRAIKERPYEGDRLNRHEAKIRALPMVCKIIEMAAQIELPESFEVHD